MPRQTKSLTDTQIKKAKPKEKEYSLSDGQGLSLRVKPNGSKLWLFNYYHPHTKKRQNIGAGIYPDTSLSRARQTRQQYREIAGGRHRPKVI